MLDLQSLQALGFRAGIRNVALQSLSPALRVTHPVHDSRYPRGAGNQFLKLPKVQPTTGGRVNSFIIGTFQQPTGGTDILYVSAPVVNGTTSSTTVGELLNQGGAGFADLGENQIDSSGVSNVAAEGNFLGRDSAMHSNLTMFYRRTWNGTTDAFINDNSLIAGTINLIDIYNGVALPSLCTLPAVGPAPCPANVGRCKVRGVRNFPSNLEPAT